jgi:hypothetical protein
MKSPSRKRSLALFLQGAVMLLGLAALAFLLGEPHLEGRNAHASTFEIYFNDPFLAYVYAGSIPFFVGLVQIFGLLADLRRTGTFSPVTLRALRIIKRCALAILGFVAGGVIFIIRFGDPEDRPAGFVMGLFIALAATIVAFGAARFARNLQRALGKDS